MRYRTIIYDFDGVILDTVAVKIDAFAHVYRAEPQEKILAVKAYAEANGGMSRYEKFRHFETVLFNRAVSAESLELLCEQYGAVVDAGVATARFIDGALESITRLHGIVEQHVVSAAPEADLAAALADRGIRHCFKTIAGAPKVKLEEFKRILAVDENPGSILAIGDSLTEFYAAVETGIPFLAIVASGVRDRFPDTVEKRPDLTALGDLVLAKA